MTERIDLADGCVRVLWSIEERYYYEMLSEYAGKKIENAQELLQHTARAFRQKTGIRPRCVCDGGGAYKGIWSGAAVPGGNPSGAAGGHPAWKQVWVKIRAESPSLHFIRATVVTEIAPIVGTEQQAKDLIGYIDETGKQDGIWETNIFGKNCGAAGQRWYSYKDFYDRGRKPGKAAGYDAKRLSTIRRAEWCASSSKRAGILYGRCDINSRTLLETPGRCISRCRCLPLRGRDYSGRCRQTAC